ncbi:NAD(P)H-hydrate dehydratase [Pilimelia columellifera]|uniref:Bifunctional NAD(P)H-hydrate repair enzyme n=1 Tax=Pilimelia columellifera subsp. columellifera TaxID=706583 RepID=A0ABN3NGW1_9ACTN
MRAAYRVADVRSAEAALLATVPPGALMARAAAGLARRCGQLLSERGGRYGSRAVLLVGPGDNGGDALFAGAELARQGVRVSAVAVVPDRIHAGGLAALRSAGGRLADEALSAPCDLVVDGIVGIGGVGPLLGRALALVGAVTAVPASAGGPVVVAVDLPSGVSADTGDVPGPAVRADVTVTFGCLKPALVVGPAAELAGEVELVDIGLGPFVRAEPAVRVADDGDVRSWWPVPGPQSDKYLRGVVALATGSVTYPGAAVLSVGGAAAGPAGLIRYAGAAREQVLTRHPQVIAATRVADAGRAQAWVCGSGLGSGARAIADLRAVLATPVPVVLDADAIAMLVDGAMAELLRARRAPLVLTPHDGEFARLAGAPPGADRVGAALRLAAWTNAVVLLKGSRTIVASPDGQAWANATGCAALATAGAGDVLAGLLGSLLAAGLPPVRAAVAAAYAHGLAGRAAARVGAVTATDLVTALPTVTGSLTAPCR